MRKVNHVIAACVCTCAACTVFTRLCEAHGFVGDRFFPPTITTDDPFAVDELAFPTISYVPGSDNRETDYGFEFDKEIFPHFALGVSDTYISQSGRNGAPSAYGWDNLTLTAKYELWQNDAHEAIVAVGLETDVGGTGDKAVAESFSTFTPTIYFGKGFGDLPDSLECAQTVGRHRIDRPGTFPPKPKRPIRWSGVSRLNTACLTSSST